MTDLSRDTVIEGAAKRAGSYRWVICGLLFAATAINYIDRQLIGVLKPLLQADLGWRESQYADIVFWFQFAYAIGYIGIGRFIDVVGARFGPRLAARAAAVPRRRPGDHPVVPVGLGAWCRRRCRRPDA